MRKGRWSRGFLVAANLLLLLAAMPAVGHSGQNVKQNGKLGAAKQKADRTLVKRDDKPKPDKQIRARESGTKEGHSKTASKSSDDDDDDGASDAAGQVAGACCAGFIGAMANSSANDPSDVEHHDPEPAPPARAPAQAKAPQRVEPPPEQPPTPGPFDTKAAKTSLRKASQEVKEQCETEQEQLGDYTLTLTFGPSGHALVAEIDPPPESERLAKCARATFLRAEVPPFSGEETAVTMSFKQAAPPAPE